MTACWLFMPMLRETAQPSLEPLTPLQQASSLKKAHALQMNPDASRSFRLCIALLKEIP